jgi:hypothetical protein
MRATKDTFFLAVFFLLYYPSVYAQYKAVHEIDSVMDLSPFYLPTYYANIQSIEFEPLKFNRIDTGMTNTHLYEPLLRPEHIYQDLGASGQAHQPIVFTYQKDMGFLYQPLPYPLYFKKQSDLTFYKLQTTYSKLAYTLGFLDVTENHFFAEFAKYMRGVTISAHLYASLNTNSSKKTLRNLNGDFLIHYELPSSIYGFKASYIFNQVKHHEYDGFDELASQFTSKGSSLITVHDFSLQNYVNLKSKNDKYFGTFTYDFQLVQTTMHYNDDLDSLNPRYEFYYDSYKSTNDSTRVQSVKNALQWSNFSPYKEMSDKNNFFHIAGGVLYDYANLKYNHTPFNSLYLFARTHIRLFKVMNIRAQFYYSIVSDYANHDLAAKAEISWDLNTKKEHIIGFNAEYYKNDPEYIMQYVFVNNFRWINQFREQNIVHLKAFWNYQKYNASVSYYYLNNWVYLPETFRPTQNENDGNLIQISTFIPYRYKNFGVTTHLNMQYCAKDVVNVPLFAGKLSVFYIIELLKKKLKIMVGTDIMYNTLYYADGYLPVLHKFYYQRSQLAGNFAYIDANLTVSIERINFFVRGGNLLGTFLNQGYSTPIYPVSYLINLGICWRFHD